MGCGASGTAVGPADSIPEDTKGQTVQLRGILSGDEDRKAARRAYLKQKQDERKGKRRVALPPSVRRRRGSMSHGTGKAASFALKFPTLRAGYMPIYKTFMKKAVNEVMPVKKAIPALKSFDSSWTPDPNAVSELLESLSTDGNAVTELNFKDFLEFGTRLFFLAEDSKDRASDEFPVFKKVHDALNIIHEEFAEIDTSGDGIVELDELQVLLGETDHKNQFVLQRMKDLDINDDGKIDFGEFLYGISLWVDVAGSFQDSQT
jgi:hypothetical protein